MPPRPATFAPDVFNLKKREKGMHIIIIGATSGIGRELWKIYAGQGHRVAVVGRRGHRLMQMQAERPAFTLACKADITRTDETSRSLDRLFAELGTVDLAIVCAGTGDLNPALSFELELPAIRTNVVGWTALVDRLYARFERQGRGHLAALTSVGGLRGEPLAPAYSATKAYQISYLQALRRKSRQTGISVTEIRPGLADTRMAKGEGLFWVMPPQKVARQIAAALARRPALAVVTKRWWLISLLLRHL